MLRSASELIGYRLDARGGELGKVKDLFFDDSQWQVRYFVVDTGKWLPGRKVLISPTVAGKPSWTRHAIPVDLSREQVASSPGIESDRPVSRQKEIELSRHFYWPRYWERLSRRRLSPAVIEKKLVLRDLNADPHLRSAGEVIGYRIQAQDGEVGRVEDFILETGDWKVAYLVLDTRTWLPGKKVLISPEWIISVDWHSGHVEVELNKQQIKSSPRYDPTAPVNRELEARVYDYYGRPKFWEG